MDLKVKQTQEKNYKWVKIISFNDKGSNSGTVPLGFPERCWILTRCCPFRIPWNPEMFVSLSWSCSSNKYLSA